MTSTKRFNKWILPAFAITMVLGACSSGSNNPNVLIETNPATLEAGKPAELILSVQDAAGQPFQDLQISHERILHVVIVSADFQEFFHIHPEDFGKIPAEMKDSARFKVQFTPKNSGKYLVATDFSNSEKSFSDTNLLEVQGSPSMNAPEKDLRTTKNFGDYDVTATAAALRSGTEQTLKFSINKNGQPVTDLQPYLAAPMHFAIIKDDQNSFTHTHGIIPTTDSMDHSLMDHSKMGHDTVPNGFGPDIEASVTFPEPGSYHLFGEFKQARKVTTIHFQFIVE